MSNFKLLHDAVINGDNDKILAILMEDVNLKARDEKGNSLLHVVFTNAELNQTQLIELLGIFLDRGLNINAKNRMGKSVLQLAVERRMRDVIDFCLKRNADPNLKHRRQNSIAHFAIEEECKKFNSLVKSDAIENFEGEENESSSFIDWMVSRGIDFFQKRNIQNYSPLYLANDLNLQHIVLILLKHVDDLALVEKDQMPFLCTFLERNLALSGMYLHFDPNKPEAIHSRHYKLRHVQNIVKVILEKSSSIDDKSLAVALRSAITSNLKMDVIEMLLQRIGSVDSHHTGGESLIQTFTRRFSHPHVIVKEDMKILRALILKGADVNERDASKDTMAHKLFCRHPKLEMLELLKEVGANFSARTGGGKSFLDLVARHGNEAGMVDVVWDDNCDVNVTNSNDETLLQVSIGSKNRFVAMDLIQLGAKVNDVYKDNRTPLSMACEMGLHQVVEKLIEYGADLGYRDENGKTLLHIALLNRMVVRSLLKNGLDVNAKDAMGKTPLHYAINEMGVRILFEAGAHVDIVDKQGRSPLYDSLRHNPFAPGTINMLLQFGASIEDPKVLELAFNNPYQLYIKSLEYFENHFMKLIAADLYDKMTAAVFYDKLTCAPTEIKENLQQFFEQCRAEVEVMKSFFIDDCTTLYGLLHKNRNRRCAYADNEKLKTLSDSAMRSKFPNYDTLIWGCYNEAVTRKPLLESAICILSQLIEIPLPDLCTEKVSSHLSNMDLLCLLEAFEGIH